MCFVNRITCVVHCGFRTRDTARSVFFCLTDSLSTVISPSVPVAADGVIPCALWLCNALCVHGPLPHPYLSMDTGCFLVLAIVNSAAVNTGVPVSF